jgi:C-terminal processing protease CtpA/Prc
MSWEIIEYAPKAVSCQVDSCTWLIRVPTCDLSFMEKTNDAFQQFVESGCKNLIIDVRGNGGGSDLIWNNYFAALYDHSGKPSIGWFRNSPENLKAWEHLLEIDHPSKERIQDFIKRCKSSNKEFVKWAIWTGDTGLKTTARINRAAVIIDWYTASAAESLVEFVKKHSDRAKVYGICNTNGADISGNCLFMDLPNSKIKFQYPTTVDSEFFEHDFSGTPGIAPDIIIPLPYPKILTDNIDEWVLWVAEDLKR